MDIRSHMDIGEQEDGTETDTRGGSTQTWEVNETVSSCTEGGQVMQGEESRGVN